MPCLACNVLTTVRAVSVPALKPEARHASGQFTGRKTLTGAVAYSVFRARRELGTTATAGRESQTDSDRRRAPYHDRMTKPTYHVRPAVAGDVPAVHDLIQF